VKFFRAVEYSRIPKSLPQNNLDRGLQLERTIIGVARMRVCALEGIYAPGHMDRKRTQRANGGPVRAAARPGISPGFSIPELLLVLLLVSVLSYLIVPNLEIVKFKMDGAARGIVAALVAAQRQAVVRQHDVIVAIDTVNRRLRIHQDRDNDGQVDAAEPIRQVPLDEGVVFGLDGAPALFSSATIGFTDTQDGMPVARFIRTGSAGEEGHIYLTSSRTISTGDYPKDTRAVKVDRATGRVTWYYYDPDQWKEGF
jgi:type II secretory pathway pseudopilin PulG